MNIKITTNVTNGGSTVGHQFNIEHSVDECINDFHLFCLAIVRDLIHNKHKFDQGSKPFTYEFEFDEENIEDLDIDLNHMADIIMRERLSFEKSLENLINPN